jgi:hypothetical protein
MAQMDLDAAEWFLALAERFPASQRRNCRAKPAAVSLRPLIPSVNRGYKIQVHKIELMWP